MSTTLNVTVRESGRLPNKVAVLPGDIFHLTIHSRTNAGKPFEHVEKIKTTSYLTCWAYVEGPGYCGYIVGDDKLAERLGI